MKETKIILLGIQTTIAQTILGQLEAHHYPYDQIILMDHHKKIPETAFYMGEEKPVLPIDLFSEKAPYIALLCDKQIPLSYPKKKIPKRARVIDCTGILSKAPCFIPHINHLNPRTRLICAPTSLSTILSHTLFPIKSKATHFQIVALIGTSFLNLEANQKLKAQSLNLLSKIPIEANLNTPSFAFNVIPELIDHEHQTSPVQLKCMTDINIKLAHCFIPVFRGISLYVSFTTKNKINLKTIYAHNPLIQYLDKPAPDFIMSNRATLSENKIYLHHETQEKSRLSFWLTGDDIQSGMALNVIHILKFLENFI